MKKLAALSLALLFVLSLSACKTGGNPDETTAGTGESTYTIESTAPESTTAATTAQVTTAKTNTTSPVTTTVPVTTTPVSITFTPVDKMVYVTVDNVWVRSTPSASGDGIATLHYGDDVRCTGTSENWYKIIYGGKECYISESCLTFDNITGNDMEAVTDTVYVSTDVVNLRRGPSTDTEILQQVTKGTAISRIGKNTNWSKVIINGTIYYVSNSCLSTTPISATTTAAH